MEKTNGRKCLVISQRDDHDLIQVLRSTGSGITRVTPEAAVKTEFDGFDSICVLGDGSPVDARLRAKLEETAAGGKRLFLEYIGSFTGLYSAGPADTTRKRLVVTGPAPLPEGGGGVAAGGSFSRPDGTVIPGLTAGDLLDDMSNRMMRPWYGVSGMTPLLVYREHIIAHTHWDAKREEITEGSDPGLWLINGSVMMCSFRLRDFNRARFAPRGAWQKVISYISEWLTGSAPSAFPEPVIRYGSDDDLSDGAAFERNLRETVGRGVAWLKRFLVDEGRGGIREGLRHEISPDGEQAKATAVRTDCSGEAAGAFRFYSELTGDGNALSISGNLKDFVFGPMTVRGGAFDGMLRWTDSAWQVCYQDDAARALLPVLYDCLFFGDNSRFPDACRTLDFLVRTTAKDGCRVARTDMPFLDEDKLRELREAEHGLASAHYNAYYHAALLLAYLHGGDEKYLDVARRGLETIMALYPDTAREQSETEEQCRLILPLAALYAATKDEKHKEMLYRVTNDLIRRKHPSGGFREWDTGYKANCSRESRGECSLLTENGDPVADLLYSVNWLPMGFAFAYRVTGDRLFFDLWRDVARFCVSTQAKSDAPAVDGSWCRAFDMELREPYGCPHDVGWAACSAETGWTNAEILMGLMFMPLTELIPLPRP